MAPTNQVDTTVPQMKLRLWCALKMISVKAVEVADLLHMGHRTVERYRSEKEQVFFSVPKLAVICRAYNINVHWVMYGEYPMFLGESGHNETANNLTTTS